MAIPIFKSTEDAYRFGVTATSEDIRSLLTLRKESEVLCNTLMASAIEAGEGGHNDVFDEILDRASIEVTRKQLYDEALQKAHEIATGLKCGTEDAVTYYQKGGN